ncbi:RraA family protein [Roseomonas sp. NAR14]|uniref:RraA family protein n=1 Tax=Roseomonas acroporae TaxID=2937791 RepID=A0A9X2BWE3_9PROT|nr:RraA family protein [Roseomonas acroporae]MCK8787708.1 RraA family protein [Roseomonas acroporae]
MERPFSAADLDFLRQWDTPTVCNALEVAVPARRGRGFSVLPFVVANNALSPICGLARVGSIRAAAPSGRSREEDRAARIGWYGYVGDAEMPTVVVIEDLDEHPGTGAFWGEVNTAVHKALGALGCVTNGSIRDLDMVAPEFQLLAGSVGPSHAHVHIVDYGREVEVHGMHCSHDDVVHADRHGAVVIPPDAVRRLPEAIELVARREKVVLDLCRSSNFSVEALRDALNRMDEIH